MKKTLCVALLFVMLLSGCNMVVTSKDEQQKMIDEAVAQAIQEKENEPAYTLTDVEQKIVDALIIASENFFSPQDLRVVNIEEGWDEESVTVKLSGTTRAGGTNTKTYMLYYQDKYYNNVKIYWPGYIEERSFHLDGEDDYSVKDINLALQEHWESKGL